MPYPVMIFTPGAWHSPNFYDQIIAILEPLGYKCVTVSMPSVGRVPPVSSMDEDIAAVRNAVLVELDAGRDVIVNAHSWSGIPVNCALDGLSKEERQKDGKYGVVKLTFVTSFLLPEGLSLEEAVGGPEDWWELHDDGNFTPINPILRFYHDLPSADGQYWANQLRPHSSAAIKAKATSAAWRRIPSAYLVCEDDRAVPVQAQEAMIAGVKKDGAKMEVERVFSSHSPHLVKPDIVVGFLRRAAGENVKQK